MSIQNVGYSSFLIQEPSHEGLSEEECHFFCDYQERCDEGDEDLVCKFKFITENPSNRKNVLFFSNGEDGDIDAVIELVSNFLKAFPLRKNLIFSFQWAEWFDAPVVDGFRGGAAVVCSEGEYWFSNNENVRAKVLEIRESRIANNIEEESKTAPISTSEEAHFVWRDRKGNWSSKQLINKQDGVATIAAVGSAIVFGGSSDSFVKGS